MPMNTSKLRSNAFTLRIIGNLVLAASLGTFIFITGDPDPPFPEWIPILFAVVGAGILVAAMLARVVPPSEAEIRRKFEEDERARNEASERHPGAPGH